MTTPTRSAVILESVTCRTAPALIADDGALWVCVRCTSVCSTDRGTVHTCRGCGARYSLHHDVVR
jgi:hypothetical protein